MDLNNQFKDREFRNKLNDLKKKFLDFKKEQPYLLIGLIALVVILMGKYLLMLIPVALMVLGSIYVWKNLF